MPFEFWPAFWAGIVGGAVMVLMSLMVKATGAPLGQLLVDPQLPEWLPDLRLEGVRVGEATLDLAFHRTPGGTTRYEAHRREGRVRVLRQPAPQGPHGTPGDRLRAALGSLIPGT